MKSSATQQSVILLALITSSVITVKDTYEIPELRAVINLGLIRLMEIIEEFPADGYENFRDTAAIMKEVSACINKPDTTFTIEVIVYLAHRICADLLGELRNPKKRELVYEAGQIISRMNDFLDPDGENEEARIEVDEILEAVYKEIGFKIEHRYIKHFRKLQRRLKHGTGATC